MRAPPPNAIKLDGQMQLLPEPPAEPSHSTRHSVQTLLVLLAAITILGVIARVFARLCDGGTDDIEGWVQTRCNSCIDGSSLPAPPSEVAEEEKK
ncbi:hypothetical protein IC582_019284 [Cucumis melo]|uniref:Uncharacterized protein LOC103499518 n=2 Tax=Cucumis melo TaxID=3656 RepID=A0A1S3CEC8_CUCME|nr:uncharacterized protein LOC103499518 [Cucumis melo]KAA0056141.1 uncharacterized protein E6C27_scaffold697G00230 [Cucumis melo var. makuwa]TYK14146.1 uncharacterized protein E5676_scaffold513G00170 [Cucumis melo var. makuwa]